MSPGGVLPWDMVDKSISPLQPPFRLFSSVVCLDRPPHFGVRLQSCASAGTSPISPDMTPHMHLISLAFKQQPAAKGKRALRAPSIVGWSSRLPSPVFAADSVAPPACHLVLAAAQASPEVIHGGAQSGNRRATIPNGRAAVEPVGTWPRSVVRARLPHDGRSDSPAR